MVRKRSWPAVSHCERVRVKGGGGGGAEDEDQKTKVRDREAEQKQNKKQREGKESGKNKVAHMMLGSETRKLEEKGIESKKLGT